MGENIWEAGGTTCLQDGVVICNPMVVLPTSHVFIFGALISAKTTDHVDAHHHLEFLDTVTGVTVLPMRSAEV